MNWPVGPVQTHEVVERGEGSMSQLECGQCRMINAGDLPSSEISRIRVKIIKRVKIMVGELMHYSNS
jgi:hypothetical protein